MILRAYLFFLCVIILIFSLAYVKKSRETVLRVASFFGILNVFSLASILGVKAVFGLVSLILLLSLYELGKNYHLKYPILLALIVAGCYGLMLSFASYLIYFIPPFLLLVALTFAGTLKMIRNPFYVYCFGVMFLAVSAASLVALYSLNPDTLWFLVAMLAFNDVTGYFAGRKFGKTLVFKVLSPKKTLEGYLGGLGGLLAGLVLFHTIIPVLAETTLFQNAILLITIFIVGNAGDLVFSKIKRSVGIKDFSNFLPGHGGILDRFDSTFTVSPLLFMFLYYLN
ncbi:phosphatidate cytidylyltransferase [Desulfosporosinus meridiei]|uniref:Phosphatidate cytidylyltransferase n=1 Tax=Desulfosporosinus meridiei (strain ATCC BAA-275 / DSM 13257 / KCTC 12902 / NCIMB 13706 / S10) TaxID=768704 RepID=J7IRQ1_DESMD|nr:phosphatidate cytidylyltransferase [Desulfosporosinus meridiei]AFQ44315.1 putative CDP-diglyceride synthetase/phosphatidate cytidylyltransferase [Desulfosporosinus meridiei DSM 13257]